MKVKIQIKNHWTGNVIFELETENNTIKKTLLEAIKTGINLRGSDLRGCDLSGSDLSGSDLRGCDLSGSSLRGSNLSGIKIKKAIVFTGLYKYITLPYITENNEERVMMGCYDRSIEEWKENFWNNQSEFPNNGDLDSKYRLMAFEFACKWIELNREKYQIKINK